MKTLGALAGLLAIALLTGCSQKEAQHEHSGAHKAPHGGVLNAIEECALGHVEALLEGKKLTLYFVGGHDRTETSLPIKARKLVLTMKLESGEHKLLELAPRPMKLAGEEVGNCSRFELEDDFLEGMKKFEVFGEVEVNGKMRKLTIRYPDGYHPGHKAHEHEHEEEGE